MKNKNELNHDKLIESEIGAQGGRPHFFARPDSCILYKTSNGLFKPSSLKSTKNLGVKKFKY